MANYFQVSFQFPGPFVNFPDDDPSSHAACANCLKAEKEAMALLDAAKVKHKHAYSWPDGSLYRFVMTEKSKAELDVALLQAHGGDYNKLITRWDISEETPDKDPHKAYHDTLESYMNAVD